MTEFDVMKKQLRRLWTWFLSGFLPLTATGIWTMTKGLAHKGWRLVSNLDTLRDVVQQAGIGLPWLIEVVTNPFFGLTLVILGVCGLPVAVQNQPGERINRVVLVAGWVLFFRRPGARSHLRNNQIIPATSQACHHATSAITHIVRTDAEAISRQAPWSQPEGICGRCRETWW